MKRLLDTRDLLDATSLQEQRSTVEKFGARRARLLVALGLLVGDFAVLAIARFRPESAGNVVFGALVFAFGIYAMVKSHAFRCPNCGTTPMATRHAIGTDTSVSAGISPFATRCEKCGFFLSARALDRELARLPNLPAAADDRRAP